MKNIIKSSHLSMFFFFISAFIMLFSTAYASNGSLVPFDELDSEYDVIVVGAGTGRVSAAIQAARMGAKVALLEETDWIGGQMTAAGVTSMDSSDITLTNGICNEFIERVRAYYNDENKNPNYPKSVGTCYWSASAIAFEPKIGQEILYAMIQDTRNMTLPNGQHPILHISLYTTVEEVFMSEDGNTVKGIRINDRPNEIRCKVLIDATEYGDVIPLTPARYRVGNYVTRNRENIQDDVYIQDFTYLAVIRKYLNGLPLNLRLNNAPNPQRDYVSIGYPGYDGYLTYEYIQEQFCRIVSGSGSLTWTGSYPVSWPVHNAYRGIPDSDNPENYTSQEPEKITKTGINWANDYPTVAPYVDMGPKLSVRYLEDLAYRRKANCEAKLKTLQFIYYAQHDLNKNDWSVDESSGFDTQYTYDNLSREVILPEFQLIEKFFPVMPYVRESRRIVGIHTLTGSEIKRTGAPLNPGGLPVAATKFSSAVAVGDYGMDLHNARDTADFEASLGDNTLSRDEIRARGPFQVPFECFIPESVDGFLAAEKNISVSRLANGAIRLQPITMLTGQAAGAIAAIAIKQDIQPRYVKPIIVQKALLDAGSALSLYTFIDVPQSNPYWTYVQLASV